MLVGWRGCVTILFQGVQYCHVIKWKKLPSDAMLHVMPGRALEYSPGRMSSGVKWCHDACHARIILRRMSSDAKVMPKWCQSDAMLKLGHITIKSDRLLVASCHSYIRATQYGGEGGGSSILGTVGKTWARFIDPHPNLKSSKYPLQNIITRCIWTWLMNQSCEFWVLDYIHTVEFVIFVTNIFV